jgi:hypothetical protein
MLGLGCAFAVATTVTTLQSHKSFLHWLQGILVFTAPFVLSCFAILAIFQSNKGNATSAEPSDVAKHYFLRQYGKPRRLKHPFSGFLFVWPALFVFCYFFATKELHNPCAFTIWRAGLVAFLGIPFGIFDALYKYGRVYSVAFAILVLSPLCLLLASTAKCS